LNLRIELICEIAELHNIELIKICKKMKKSDWLQKYKNDFCIVHKKETGTYRHLQLERIILVHISFLNSTKTQMKDINEQNIINKHIILLKKLYQLYEEGINNINDNTSLIFDYKKIIKTLMSYDNLDDIGKLKISDNTTFRKNICCVL